MEGKARKGRPCREWTNDITDWCKENLQPTGLTGRGLLDMQSTPTGDLAHGVKKEDAQILQKTISTQRIAICCVEIV